MATESAASTRCGDSIEGIGSVAYSWASGVQVCSIGDSAVHAGPNRREIWRRASRIRAPRTRHAKYTTGLLGHIFGEMISPTTTLDIASRKRAREEPAPSEKAVRAHSPEQCMGEVLRCGRITLNVGGTSFETTSTTLAGSSDYFRRMLDHGWREATDREIFVDRDPEPFAVLLSSMRSGSVLLPAHDLHLCARARCSRRWSTRPSRTAGAA